MESGIHGVESRIQECFGFPYMGRYVSGKYFFASRQRERGIKVLNNKSASNGKFSFDLLYSYPVCFMLKIKGMFLSELLYDKLTKGYFIGMLCRVSRS